MMRFMDTMTFLLERLTALDGSEIVALSRSSGVPYNTILNIRKGVTPNPRINTVESLVTALKKRRRLVKVAA